MTDEELSDKEILKLVKGDSWLKGRVQDKKNEVDEEKAQKAKVKRWAKELDELVAKLDGAKIVKAVVKDYRYDDYDSYSRVIIHTDKTVFVAYDIVEGTE